LRDTTSNYRLAATRRCSLALCATLVMQMQMCSSVVSLHVCICFCVTSAVQTARLHETCLPNAVHARCIQVQLCQISQLDAADTTNAHVLVHGHAQVPAVAITQPLLFDFLGSQTSAASQEHELHAALFSLPLPLPLGHMVNLDISQCCAG